MNQQSQLCAAIQGAKAVRIKDANILKCRQAGWRDWAERRWSREAREFQAKELPLLQEAFAWLFHQPNNRGSVATELQTVLYQSNLIKEEQTDNATTTTTAAVAAATTNDDNSNDVDNATTATTATTGNDDSSDDSNNDDVTP